MALPKILVTNANGKTGFATTRQLLAKGYPVRAFKSFWSGYHKKFHVLE